MIDIFRSELLAAAGFEHHGFTARTGGVSTGPYESLNLAYDVGDDDAAVAENLTRLRAALGVDAPLLRVRQVHGNRVARAGELLAAGAGDWAAAPAVEADAITVVCADGRFKITRVQPADGKKVDAGAWAASANIAVKARFA